MELAAREVGTWRLVAQRVVPALDDAAAVVEHLAAVQAQDLRAAATAVALRTPAGTTTGLAAALDAGRVVRSWPMRGTLHLLPAADLPWVLGLCAGRVAAATARIRRQRGTTESDLVAAREIAEEFLTRSGRATRAELLAAFQDGGQATGGQRGYDLVVHLALTGVLCLGPLAGREQLFVLVADWIRERRAPADPLAEWARRYLRGHGPATPADFATWAGLTLGGARRGFAAVRDEFEAVLVDGVEHLLDPGLPDLVAAHRRAARALHVLPGFDEFLLGYGDRRHVLPAEHADRVAPGGNGVFRGTVVVGGRVVGTWTRKGAGITTEAFTGFSTAQEAALARRERRLPSGWLG
ncbi:winged helix DNA-binding domain-containing protein [Kineococcus sp. SYSU DK003]|uniref:winged helix DNA-binding domain-containing protein n=1 Tax=Kineococcus sp. SYSU DK003 TaxID=3383124 RepID=UPI003D7DE665